MSALEDAIEALESQSSQTSSIDDESKSRARDFLDGFFDDNQEVFDNIGESLQQLGDDLKSNLTE